MARAATTRLEPGQHSIDRAQPFPHGDGWALRWRLRLPSGRLLDKTSKAPTKALLRARARQTAQELLTAPGTGSWTQRTPVLEYMEAVTLPDDIAARVEGKSSLGRLGLLTHATAGFVDPGFTGHVTLELSNVATLPIKLWPGMKIGQLCFFQLSSAAEHPYGTRVRGSHYQGQRGPTASRSFENFSRSGLT